MLGRHRGYPEMLRAVIDMISSGQFSRGNSELFRPFIHALCHQDEYMLFADYASYIEAQRVVGQTYRDRKKWANMSVLNVARMGKFSSDRAIKEYCNDIWDVKPMPIEL